MTLFELSASLSHKKPFNSTTINYSVPKTSFVIKIYDVLDREKEKLVDEEKSPDQYEVKFNTKRLSSEVYFYQIRAGNFVETKKLVLLK